jgi:hypothetical protein
MRLVVVAAAALAVIAGCGDDGATGGAAAGGAGSGGAPSEWASYCAEVYCPQRAEQAAATGCDPDEQCEVGCEVLAKDCHPEVQALQACAADAELTCYATDEGSTVDVVPGQCAAELNALYLCAEGSCDAFDDAPCSALTCDDGSIIRHCDGGACSASAVTSCDEQRACTSEDFTEVCPTIACQSAAQQGCLPSGFCQVSCEQG